jgi:quinol monooxygenase YgiN
MASMFVKHKAADFGKWKRAYDEFDWARKQHGITAASVHRSPEDPNLIIVVHRFKDMDSAKKFANSETLQSTMQKAGVQGRPEIWFGEDVEHVTYS